MSFRTNAVKVQAFAGALFGVQVGSTTMAQVNADITSAGGLALALNGYYASSFGGVANATVAASVAANLGLTGDALASGTAYITAQLNAAAAVSRGSVISTILDQFAGLTADATFGAAAIAYNTKVTAAVAYTGADNVAIGSTVGQGSNFAMTSGVDTLTGTAGNDTFTAVIDGTTDAVVSTLTVLDTINGGNGTDVLNLNIVNGEGKAGTAVLLLPDVAVSSIETVNIRSAVALGLANTSTFSGLTTLNSTAVGNATLTAPATADVVSTITNFAAPSAVNGGNNVTVNATATATAGGTITVTKPAGNVVVNSNLVATADTTIGAITVTGGDTVAVKTSASTAVDTTVTNAQVVVTGDAGTTEVTIDQTALATKTAASAGVINNATVSTITDGAAAAGADTIATVTLRNFGATTIASSALSTLNVTGGASLASGALILNSQSVVTPVTSLTLNSAGGSMGAISGSNKYTTIDINSAGATIIADLTSATATQLNFTGAGNTTLTANTLGTLLVDINVTGAGGVTLGGAALDVGADFDGGDGNDTITLGATTKGITMGAGNDTVTLTAVLGTGGTVDGGDGTDVLAVAATTGLAATINAATGFELFGLGNKTAAAASYDMTGITALTAITTTNAIPFAVGTLSTSTTAAGQPTAAAQTVTALAPIATLKIAHNLTADGGPGYAGVGANSTDGGAGIETILSLAPLNTDVTKNDAITITLEGVTVSAAGGAGGNVFSGDNFNGGAGGKGGTAISALLYETVNIISNASADGTKTTNTITANGGVGGTKSAVGGVAGANGVNGSSLLMTAGGTVNISGEAALNMGTIGGVTSSHYSVNASTMIGNLTVGTAAGNDIIVGGLGNDTISGNDGADTITGGAGDDAIIGGVGADKMTGGDGADKFVFQLLTAAESGSAVGSGTTAPVTTTADTISGFVTGTDKISIALALGAVAAANGLVPTGGTAYTPASTGLAAADFVSINLGGAMTAVMPTATASGRFLYDNTAGVLYYDANGDSAIGVTGVYTAGASNDFVVLKIGTPTATNTIAATDFIFA